MGELRGGASGSPCQEHSSIAHCNKDSEERGKKRGKIFFFSLSSLHLSSHLRSLCNVILPLWPATMPEKEKRLWWKLNQLKRKQLKLKLKQAEDAGM